MRSDEVEDRIRRLGDAVGAATVVRWRDVDGPGAPRRENEHRSVRSVLIPAVAFVLAVLGVAVGVVVLRAADEVAVSSGDPSSAGGVAAAEGLPRLAPRVLPAGYVLDTVQVTSGQTPPVPQIRRFRSTDGVPLDLQVVPAASTDSYIDPGFAGAEMTVDDDGNPTAVPKQSGESVQVNGQHGVAVRSMTSIVTGDASHAGYVVSWYDAGGNRLVLSTQGMTQDETVEIARAATVDGSVDAPIPNIDAAAVPTGLVETYLGPDYGAIGEAKGPFSPGVVVLGYRDTRHAPPADPTVRFTPKVEIREYALPPGGDPQSWLHSFGPTSQTFSGGGIDFTLVPSAGLGAPSPVYGVGAGALLLVTGLGPTSDELREMMASVHDLVPSDWAAYLASADTSPFPPRVEAPDDTPLCNGLRDVQSQWQGEMVRGQLIADSSSESTPGTVAEDVRRDLEAMAPAQQAEDLRVISAAHSRAGQLSHDEIVSIRNAVRDLESWTRHHCAADSHADPVDLYPLTQGLPSLDDQDPALDDFCQGFQAMKPYETTTPDGQTDLPAKADQLELLLSDIPAEYPDVRTKVTELIERWREIPVGAPPPLRPNDPLGLNVPAIAQRCPDWPT